MPAHTTRRAPCMTTPVEWQLLAAYAIDAAQLSLPLSSLYIFLSTDLRASPEAIAAFYATVFIPWSLKLVYGFISDSLPVAGMRRRPYLVLYNLIASVCFAATGAMVHTMPVMVILGFATQVCLCGSEVMLDSIVVDRVALLHPSAAKGQQSLAVVHRPVTPHASGADDDDDSPASRAARLQGLCLMMRYLGTVVATVLSVVLLFLDVPARTVIGATAVLPVLTALLAATGLNSVPDPTDTTVAGVGKAPVSGAAVTATVETGSVTLDLGDKQAGASAAAEVPAKVAAAHGEGLRTALLAAPLAVMSPNATADRHPGSLARGSLGSCLRYAVSRPRTLWTKAIQFLRTVFLASPPLWPIMLFVFCLKAVPTTTAIMPSYILDQGVKNWQFSLIDAGQAAGGAIGAAVYSRFLSHVPLWSVFVWTSVVGGLSVATQVVLATGAYHTVLHTTIVPFALVDGILVGAAVAAAFLPVVVLASSCAPRGLEASAFAAVLSVVDAASSLSDYLAAGLAAAFDLTYGSWSRLWVMVVICAGLRVAPVLLLGWPLRHRINALSLKKQRHGSRSVSAASVPEVNGRACHAGETTRSSGVCAGDPPSSRGEGRSTGGIIVTPLGSE